MHLEGDDRHRAADVLSQLLHLSGLTPGALADRAGVSRALVGDYLRSAKQPSYAQILRLARAAGFAVVPELVPLHVPMTLATLGAALVEAADGHRWVLLQEFLLDCAEAPAEHRAAMIADPPPSVDERWDALLDGLAEHLAFHGGIPLPGWVDGALRRLPRWWFPGAADAAGRSDRLASAPAALAVRGVMVEHALFERVA